MLTPTSYGGFGMVDHEEIITAMNCKQILHNLVGKHPIKEIIEGLQRNPDSKLNPEARLQIDDPLLNYCKIISVINHKAFDQPQDLLEQDRIRMTAKEIQTN